MREIRTSGSPSGDWNRSGYKSDHAGPPPRQSSTLPKGRDDRAGFCPRGRARERKHSRALWCSEHVRPRGQKTSEGAAAQSVLARTWKKGRTSLKCNDLDSLNKRLGEICGLICFDLSSLAPTPPDVKTCCWRGGHVGERRASVGRPMGNARTARCPGLSTRPEGRAPVRRTRPHAHRAPGRPSRAPMGVSSRDKAGLIATVDHADMRGLGTTGLHCVAELAFL